MRICTTRLLKSHSFRLVGRPALLTIPCGVNAMDGDAGKSSRMLGVLMLWIWVAAALPGDGAAQTMQ